MSSHLIPHWKNLVEFTQVNPTKIETIHLGLWTLSVFHAVLVYCEPPEIYQNYQVSDFSIQGKNLFKSNGFTVTVSSFT